MSRFARGVVVVSAPIHTFPNGDYFFIEMARKNGSYECRMKMARTGKGGRPIPLVRVQARTVREAQERCYELGIEKCPRLPRPPYFKRGNDDVRLPGTAPGADD